MILRHLIASTVFCVMTTTSWAIECRIAQTKVFVPQNKTVALARLKGTAETSNAILFKTALRVNTDGAPTSYHPADPRGISKAINNVVNGVSISKSGTKLSYGQKIEAFERFRDAAFKVPTGHKISWGNVIATVSKDGYAQPCVFSSGPNKGYFGSLTTLKNGLPSDQWGECESANQLDQRSVPGLVLPGGSNPLKSFGAKIGDLVFAYNASNGKSVAAVLADGGPKENLGEGSVAMNMALLGKTTQPTTYQEAKNLDTGTTRMMVAIIPASKDFALERPYSAENIAARVNAWAEANGYTNSDGLKAFLAECSKKL